MRSALHSSERRLSMQLDVDFYRDRPTVTHLMIELQSFQTQTVRGFHERHN